jgi:hypothetical protein
LAPPKTPKLHFAPNHPWQAQPLITTYVMALLISWPLNLFSIYDVRHLFMVLEHLQLYLGISPSLPDGHEMSARVAAEMTARSGLHGCTYTPAAGPSASILFARSHKSQCPLLSFLRGDCSVGMPPAGGERTTVL